MKNIDGYLREGYEKWRDKPYIWSRNRTDGVFRPVTYGQTAEAVWHMASALKSLGLSGNGVIYGENSFPWMVLDLCLMGYTGISVPIDKEWTLFDIRNCLNSLEVSLFFYSADKKETVEQLSLERPDIRFVCMEEEFDSLAELGIGREIPPAQEDLEQTVKILFTSGTTAFPKAIPLTQNNLFSNWETLFQRTPMTAQDRSCLFLPLNHVYSGVANFLYTIISGMELYLCSDKRNLIQDMTEIRPTVVCTVPVIVKAMVPKLQEKDVLSMLQGIRFLYCGGSPVGLELKTRFRSLGIHLIEAYGTTETASVIALERPEDDNLLSGGTVFENLKVKIEEPDENGIGEICVSGGSRTAGYLNCSDNTLYFDADGYYHTGDLGCLDEERRLYLKGRKRRMLDKGNGKNVYADELETLLLSNPSIIRASVYLKDGLVTASLMTNAPDKEICSFLEDINDRLPRFKQIERFLLNESFTGSWFKE